MMHRHNNKQSSSAAAMDDSGRSNKSGKSGHSSSNNNHKNKRRTLDWRPRTPEEIVRKKNRRVINQHLKRIGKTAGRELSLDDNGVCCFSFKKFVLCVEVPEDQSDICLFYCMVSALEPTDNRTEVERFTRLYNTRHQQQSNSSSGESSNELDISSTSENTVASADPLDLHQNGIRLCMQPNDDEINLCLSFPINKTLKYHHTADKLEFFIKSAVQVNRKLDKARFTPIPVQEDKEAEAAPSPCAGRRLRIWSADSQTSTSNMSQCSIFSLFGHNSP